MLLGNSAVVLLLWIFTGQITGQETTVSQALPTQSPIVSPKLCNESSNMDFEINNISGVWYELARNPAPKNSLLCSQLNLTVLPNNALDISFTYSNTPDFPWVNQTMYANISVQHNNTQGYNISFTMYNKAYPYSTYKVLDTNYLTYTFVCGYTNVSDFSTFFGIVLTRQRIFNSSVLTEYEDIAQSKYSLFSNTSMTTISQTLECTSNYGAVTKKMVSYAMALFYVAISLLC